MTKKILIVASGTGGHVIPALNIAERLLNDNFKIIWIGTKRGIENKLVNNEIIKLKHINSTGIRGKSFFGKVMGLLNFIKAFFQCYIIIKKEKPIFIFGFGGYVSTSASLASFFCRVPVYVHEANSVPGTANKINHMISKKTFETFPDTFSENNKIISSGNPIKPIFTDIEHPKYKYMKKTDVSNILIFGGSQGAVFFNENIPISLTGLSTKLNVKHICGMDNKISLQKTYRQLNITHEVIEFSYDMNILYDWADIIISRAGSMTLSEISASGRASILVPYRYATDNHQFINAKYLQDNNASIVVEENEKFSDNLSITLTHLIHNISDVRSMAINVKSLFPEDSSDIILENISELHEKYDNSAS
jgi:UDP-N-acetylglucosamine--N-acetylmuramyl-(pentapeptide) pyrophosphoryl-undecaprenol N-acetylglucosamine transferase